MVAAMQLLFGNELLASVFCNPNHWWIWTILLAASLIAGLVDTIAGGGGMIVLPILLAVGLPPHLALGTNKLQSSFGSLTATLRFRSAGLISLRNFLPALVATFIGAGLGALTVGLLDAAILKLLIPLFLSGIFLFLLINPHFGHQPNQARVPLGVVWLLGGLILGFYDGFFGPGTGTFWAMLLVGLAGMDLRSATAHTKAVNFTSNIVSLTIFLMSGTVVLAVGLLMGAGQIIGARIGSHLVLKRGIGLIRVLVLSVSAVMIVYLLLRWFLKF